MTRAERNIAWIEGHLYVPDGQLYGQPVVLDPWQKKELRRIYDNPFGTRMAILSFARKNGKTALAAMLVLLHLCGPEAQPNTGLYSAARSREQAAVLFDYAAKMVRLSGVLNLYVKVVDSRKELHCPDLGTVYKALSAEAKTKFGLSPAFLVHDELGQVKGPRDALYTALESATGAQLRPMSVVISTQASTDADLLSVLIDDAPNDPRTVLALYTAPMDLDPFSEEAIRAANPGFDTLMNKAEVMGMRDRARRLPSEEADYRNLHLNQRVSVHAPYLPRAVWEALAGEVAAKFTRDIYGGLDLSEVNDLTAWVGICDQEKDGRWQIKPTFWLPEYEIQERSRKDRVPYDKWAEQGFLMLCPGKAVSYEYVAAWCAGQLRTTKIKKIGFDRWGFRHFKPWLVKAKLKDADLLKFVPVGMGEATMSPALRTLETDALSALLVHANHPVLNTCIWNAVVSKRGDTGNRLLSKEHSRGRIDGAVALAIARAVAAEDEQPAAAGIRLL